MNGDDMGLLSEWTDQPDALAGLGAFGSEKQPPAERLERIAGRRSVRLQYGALPQPEPSLTARLADAWSVVARNLDPGPLEQGMRVVVSADGDGLAIQAALQRASGVEAVALADWSLRSDGTFAWPLVVGFGPSRFLEDDVVSYGHAHLTELRGVVAEWEDLDLLIAHIDDVGSFRANNAAMLLLLTDDAERVAHGIPERYESPQSHSLIAVVEAPPSRRDFVTGLFDGFAHNYTPDRAVAYAARYQGLAHVVVAHPDYLDGARVTGAVARSRLRVEQALARGHLTAERFVEAAGPLYGIGVLGDESFLAEGLDATAAIEPLRNAEAVLEADVPRRLGPQDDLRPVERHLQAQVYARLGGLVQRLNSFEPDTGHKIVVRIGATSTDWISVEAPFPDIHPPTDEHLQMLTVHLIAPALSPPSAQATVVLGKTGDSSPAEFDVDVLPSVSQVDATIIVYRGTTHLQTAVLSAPVNAGDEPVGDATLTFSKGDASGVDLDLREDPDLSMRVATDTILIKHAGRSREVELPGLADAVDPLRRELFDIAGRLDALKQPLSSPNGTKLLRTLARHGRFLRTRLFGDGPVEADTVEVTSASSGKFLPVEFFYDYEKPSDGALLCSAFSRSKGPECPDCEARDDPGFVCPSGMWGLNRLIERQIRTVADIDCVAPEPRRDERRLAATHDVVFAASSNVNTTSDPERVDNTIADLEAIAGNVHVADTWVRWKEHVNGHSPALLVALPHNVDTGQNIEALQIGDEEDRIELALDDVGTVHVGPPSLQPGPVMLLLGCNTADPAIEYQDFVRQMRCKGAAVVVSTLTYVLGQQAAPFATALVRALWSGNGEAPFGEVLRRVRADMLRADNPMALAVTAFGAQDWIFTTGED